MHIYRKLLFKKGFSKIPEEGYQEFVDRVLEQSSFNKKLHREFINLWVKAYYSDKNLDLNQLDIRLKKIKNELS